MPDGDGKARILHSIGPAQMAGTQRALATYLAGCDRDRFEHHVVCSSPGPLVERLRELEVAVTIAPSRYQWHPVALMTLARRLRRGRFDIFHANPSRAEAAIARGLGIPVVCRRNVGFDGYWARWRQHGVVCRLLNAPVDRFIVPARFLVDEYARRGVARERVRLVHNGVSVRVPGRAEIKRARAEMGDGRAPLIVSAGRLVALKGHRLLIAAAARLKSQGAAFRVAIIGDGEERPSLEDLARASGVGERVRLLGWRAQVAPYLAAAAIYVQPSLSDVLPNTVLEAMALGRCVVASDVGGLRDAIEPGYSGALTPPGDAAALAHELGLLLANKAARACFGAAAQRTIARDFTVAEMVRRTEAVYRELIEVQR